MGIRCPDCLSCRQGGSGIRDRSSGPADLSTHTPFDTLLYREILMPCDNYKPSEGWTWTDCKLLAKVAQFLTEAWQNTRDVGAQKTDSFCCSLPRLDQSSLFMAVLIGIWSNSNIHDQLLRFFSQQPTVENWSCVDQVFGTDDQVSVRGRSIEPAGQSDHTRVCTLPQKTTATFKTVFSSWKHPNWGLIPSSRPWIWSELKTLEVKQFETLLSHRTWANRQV